MMQRRRGDGLLGPMDPGFDSAKMKGIRGNTDFGFATALVPINSKQPALNDMSPATSPNRMAGLRGKGKQTCLCR